MPATERMTIAERYSYLRRMAETYQQASRAEPGHFETDLVHHAGGSAAGDYVHTLQLIDVATGWSERVAVVGRSQTAMEGGFQRVLDRLPFPITELLLLRRRQRITDTRRKEDPGFAHILR